MRVLITGAGGFIGRHLVADQLSRGRQVTALDLKEETLQPFAGNSNIQILQGDFTDFEQVGRHLADHDICFHLASAHLETGISSDYFWHVNVEGTRAFVKHCYEAGIGRFIHCSSVGVYGNIENPPVDEEAECYPDVAYEKTKLAGEQAVRDYARSTGYNTVIVRPAWVYGPGCPRTRRLFRTIKKGRFFYVGGGKTLRHPIYISDMVEGFEAAATHEEAVGEVFIMAGPRPVTLRELANEIAQTVGVSAPKLKVPKALIWPIAYAFEVAGTTLGRDVPITRRSLKFFTGNTAFVTTKAQEVLGYNAEIDLAEGLQQTYRWMIETGSI